MKAETITALSLTDQVIAVLRVWREESSMYRLASEIAKALSRGQGEVIHALQNLYDIGAVQRFVEGTTTRYRVSELGERTKGCCCCCHAKLYDPRQPFCQDCGPHFDGRI